MLGKLLGLSGSADLYFPGWNTRPNLMCRNFGAMGNYSTCSNDSSFSNVSLVKHSGIHTDESAFSDCGSALRWFLIGGGAALCKSLRLVLLAEQALLGGLAYLGLFCRDERGAVGLGPADGLYLFLTGPAAGGEGRKALFQHGAAALGVSDRKSVV